MIATLASYRGKTPPGSSAVEKAGWHADTTLGDELDEAARLCPESTVVVASEGVLSEVTIGEIHARARRLAVGFRDLGLRPGDAVLSQLPNSIDALVVTSAVLQAGLVLVPVIHTFGTTELQFIARQSSARAIVTPRHWSGIDFTERVAAIDAPELVHRLKTGGDAWAALHAASDDRFGRAERDADDVAAIIYTSGTTADPKGVLHSHNSLLAGLRRERIESGNRVSRQRHFSPSPAGHIASLAVALELLVNGRVTGILDRWDVEVALRVCQAMEPLHMNGAPFFYIALLDYLDRTGAAATLPRTFQTGGAAVSPRLI